MKVPPTKNFWPGPAVAALMSLKPVAFKMRVTLLGVGLLELIVPPFVTVTEPIRSSVARPVVKPLAFVEGSTGDA